MSLLRLIGAKSPYNYGINEVRWLNEGEVTAPAEGESINLYGKVAILVSDKPLHRRELILFLYPLC